MLVSSWSTCSTVYGGYLTQIHLSKLVNFSAHVKIVKAVFDGVEVPG